MRLFFPIIFLLITDSNDAGFFIKKKQDGFCVVGRSLREREEVLLGINFKFFHLALGESSYSYTTIPFQKGCLAGVVFEEEGKLKTAFVYYTEEKKKILKIFEGNLMLWHIYKAEDSFILTGGIKGRTWKPFIAEISENLNIKSFKILNLEGYFYAAVKTKNELYAVGRVFLDGWDALIYKKQRNREFIYSLGGEGKDYLRYIDIIHGKPIAVGRTEIDGESDFLVVDLGSMKYYTYDIGEYDYARSVSPYGSGFIIAGETRLNNDNDGIFLILSEEYNPLKAYRLGGQHADAVRFMDYPFFTGYTYSYDFKSKLLIGLFSDNFPEIKLRKINRKLEWYLLQRVVK